MRHSEKEQNLRPCIANGKKARFHRWSGRSEIIEPSPLVGGHNGGVIQWTVALVEYEDGTIGEVLPKNIRFTDTESEAADYIENIHTEREAAEKKKKTKVHYEGRAYFCSSCGFPLHRQRDEGNYCSACGAALDWEEMEVVE